MQILIGIVLAVIAVLMFELIIFSHEFGHFITAKKSGVKVNEFALGMGPKIFGFTKGETAYTLRLFPIGGFCAMEGEDEDSAEPRAFNNAKIWKRMIIIVAGAVMNIILGFILMFIFVVQANGYVSTTVSGFYPNSVTANCGLMEGDEITEINGYSIINSRDLQFAMATLNCTEVDGTTLEIYKQDCASEATSYYSDIIRSDENITEDKAEELYKILVDGCKKINATTDKESAYGILTDICTSIRKEYDGGKAEIPTINEREARKRYTADVKVLRDGQSLELTNVQFYTFYASKEDQEAEKTSVAFDFSVEPIEKNVGTVISQTVSGAWSMAKMVWTSLVWLVQGRFSFSELSGPVGIATAVKYTASQGLQTSFTDAVNNILYLMILITVNLGIVNMLPFPALDGGRFVFLIIEGIFRKPIPRKVEQYVNAAGLALLMMFMFIISVKDVWQLATGTMPGM
ncbi:MAG: RIP metalloprotease RseP [Ruminococcus sp.]|nr:RIP metalloprotease RseP [Ruminococcus sp.]